MRSRSNRWRRPKELIRKYKVHVVLDEEYDDIEARTPYQAFEIASDAAISGGTWSWYCEEVKDNDNI